MPKLSMGLSKTPMNAYIASVYTSTKNSSYTKCNEFNIIDTLRDQLNEFSPNGMAFIEGGFNTRIGKQNDFIVKNKKNLNY